ncbi:hypothetical protein GCM10027343_38340 [Noviherbaspirillum agri]
MLQGIGGSAHARRESVTGLLSAIRRHLQMDVAFVSEFTQGRRVFRHVDPVDPGNPVKAGGGDPLEESYCQRVVDGRLPELMNDARDHPVAAALPVTHTLPVGAHVSVPIRLADGNVYGTFCCFSYTPDHTLDQRDLSMIRVFAEVAARLIDRDQEASRRRETLEAGILDVLQHDALRMVYQPIYDMSKDRIAGFEALARFSPRPHRPPDSWFKDANEIGLGLELETKAIHMAVLALQHLPDDVYVSVNLSPQHILQGALDDIFSDRSLHRVVLEITEHTVVDYYDDLIMRIRPFRERGLQIAVDDAGAGYASFRHILNLAPERIKLDMSLTRDIDGDASRRALAAAFSMFSRETGAIIVAEGVESASEIETLRELGISHMQGYHLGQPVPLEQAARMPVH